MWHYVGITRVPFLELVSFKVFMGDVGVLFRARRFDISCWKFGNYFKILIIVSPLFADALICLLRRLFYRQKISKPIAPTYIKDLLDLMESFSGNPWDVY